MDTPRLQQVVLGFLNYSFKDINWEYSGLTTAEKEICTEREFEALRKWLGIMPRALGGPGAG